MSSSRATVRRLGIVVVVIVVGLAACASGPSPEAGTATSSPTSSATHCTVAAGAPQGGRHHLTVDGTRRSYLLSAPTARAARPAPLIVGLHGFGGTAADFEARTRLGEEGASADAYVAIPDALGVPARWNFDRRPDGPDDFAFIEALVAQLADGTCVDPDRVSLVGSSNGAAFAGLLVCARPQRFAAVAMVIATVPTACPGSRTPSVLTIRGTEDHHVPFDGVTDLIADDAAHRACRAGPLAEHPARGVERTRYTGCRQGAEVVLDAVRGGGHEWPASGSGSGRSGYDATEQVLAFFGLRGVR